MRGRHITLENSVRENVPIKKHKKKKIRRSVVKKTKNAVINIMYSNIQGFTKKKEILILLLLLLLHPLRIK